MGVLDRLEDEFVDVSMSRATVRELFELAFGSVLFVLLAGGLAYYLLGRTVALAVVAVLAVVFTITVASQAYWALTGRADYED
ncbi:hypothetical protein CHINAEXTREME_12635 [Halobiforma lacisalsi AJ5]|uniref:Uncharacterized protein n=1 Tax=Natronobacterium lacisalsi AJ5 TaxID=358396 RepID=M0LJ47_NATLA|nr:hypothetical protein [Halobiforma lacisalsi]APW98569.1 hypothetical protein CHINAEXTREME_12635 [Halobiforma lacisalsi AJ5]EMA33098.1 hypothetical protein C445_09940 [Halobiforma lacisalsi AJ5]